MRDSQRCFIVSYWRLTVICAVSRATTFVSWDGNFKLLLLWFDGHPYHITPPLKLIVI